MFTLDLKHLVISLIEFSEVQQIGRIWFILQFLVLREGKWRWQYESTRVCLAFVMKYWILLLWLTPVLSYSWKPMFLALFRKWYKEGTLQMETFYS
jgi:hypothetical protein